MVRRKHFTERVEQIEKLSQEEQYEPALALLRECISATAAESAAQGWAPAPWYTDKAAIIYRKLKRPEEEVAVLKAYLAALPPGSTNGSTSDRLSKAEDILHAKQEAEIPVACPACGQVLEHPPTAKGTCPSCGSPIVVRKVAGQPKLFTPEQAAQFAADDKRERARRELLLTASYFGVTEADWQSEVSALRARFNAEPRDGDVFWGLANGAIVRLGTAGDWTGVSRTYFDMGKFVVAEGKDWLYLGKAKADADMRGAAQYNTPATEMILLTCACPVCVVDNLTVKPLRALLADFPFPHAECEKPPCACQVRQKYY